MSPSEYFARNCLLGASLLTATETKARDDIGVSRIMWGQDYPHAEGTFPYTRESLNLVFGDVGERDRRSILAENAAELYRFDLGQLQTIADVHGPSPQEVDRPVEKLPQVPDDTYSPVFAVGLADLRSS
jgi:hypothetical protein